MGLIFRLAENASFSSGLMMRLVRMGRCLSQNRGKPFLDSRLRFQLVKEGEVFDSVSNFGIGVVWDMPLCDFSFTRLARWVMVYC